MPLYESSDFQRQQKIPSTREELRARPPFRRDYARLIHSPAFRRLQGKTQLFPGRESDFFRNRLTHSIEVAQIAKAIALRLNAQRPRKRSNAIDCDLVEVASLAHDLGHPPFGHNGEAALDECMCDYGGFEGNAQTLRILARLEKKGAKVEPFSGTNGEDTRVGLNLTYRTLASVLKYDREIPLLSADRPVPNQLCKGYYYSEAELVRTVKRCVIGASDYKGPFRTIECQIMDLADDIAYSTYDLEDALKAEFISPLEVLTDAFEPDLLERIAAKVQQKIGAEFSSGHVLKTLLELFVVEVLPDHKIILERVRSTPPNNAELLASYIRSMAQTSAASKRIACDGYYRNQLTSEFVDKFVSGVECLWNEQAPAFSEVRFSAEVLRLVEVLKHYTYEKQIQSPRLKVAEYRGKQIVRELFKALNNDGSSLLPDDFGALYKAAKSERDKCRVICDFIAGMTDLYAIEFYGRLTSESPQTIFKPI